MNELNYTRDWARVYMLNCMDWLFIEWHVIHISLFIPGILWMKFDLLNWHNNSALGNPTA